MNALPFIPKDHHELPDAYGLKVLYVNGKQEDFELASHTLHKETHSLEFVTKEDLWNWIPLSSIQRVEFDKRMSKIMALKQQKTGV